MTDRPDTAGEDFSLLLRPVTSRGLRRLPTLVRRAALLVWRAAPRELARSVVLQLFAAGALTVQVLLAREVLDVLLDEDDLRSGRALPLLLLLAAASALLAFANQARVEQQRLLADLVARHAVDQVLEVATAVRVIAFDSPGFHNRLQRAMVNAAVRPTQMTTGVLGLSSAGLTITGLAVALALLEPLFLFVVLGAYVPLWLATVRMSKVAYDFGVEQTERDRQRDYLSMVLTRREEAGEVRAYGLAGHLRTRHAALWEQRLEALRALVAKRLRYGAVGGVITAALTAGSVALLVLSVDLGRLTLAEAGAAATALLLLGQRLQVLVSSTGALYESSLFIEDFTSFVDLMPTVRDARGTALPPVPFQRLDVDRVSFRYPSRQVDALHDVSFTLRRGEVLALVGENGSGKTTLAKLLAGLYVPSGGVITWDGVDLATCDPERVHDAVGVIFQDFARYALTVRENIGFGRLDAADDDAVARAGRLAGADAFVAALPQGYDTRLGSQFHGASDLSGGQWQRVALARAFLRDAPLLVLDEPSAAMDARAEAALFDRVRELYQGRTVVLVSHRFSTVRFADRILVLKDGRVHEQGDHDALMRAGGLYAELFTLQAAAFRDDPDVPDPAVSA